ncbi:hypothetical protein BU24DRAFT_426585 [Aaosphaeria arxii CBS 175.79]|uniref:F-box domain-containing protein n=1 Tax=Aaosphaeria arxii CBS 175.79 TaxID=1450172 RepID=A0A6A5XEK2_9PLEO|nr:uncharacterized protein BU24DRAFT_426585 [Aaosphaeria arxii CBS 175.79]KAF2011502.1 hypothetical protein BU24DRAFT_426585 [Aaosphaeria arxii CBS 175.79]
MAENSSIALEERFEKHLEVLSARIEKLEKLMSPPGTPAPTSRLLSLPIELRLEVYRHCIPQNRTVDVELSCFIYQSSDLDDMQDFAGFIYDLEDGSGDRPDLANNISISTYRNGIKSNLNSILRVSKQISEEALNVLYGDNYFELRLTGFGKSQFRRNFSYQNRQRIKRLVLIAQPEDSSCTKQSRVDDALWRFMLPQLTMLRIVIDTPVYKENIFDARTPKQKMEQCINWLLPYMQCFGQYLRAETKVEVDANGHAEMEELAKDCLPHGYQKVKYLRFGFFIL